MLGDPNGLERLAGQVVEAGVDRALQPDHAEQRAAPQAGWHPQLVAERVLPGHHEAAFMTRAMTSSRSASERRSIAFRTPPAVSGTVTVFGRNPASIAA